MSRISILDLSNTLEETREILLNAGGEDGMVSRADLRKLIESLSSEQLKRFIEMFYDFLRRLENRPRMRVTEETIDRGIAFIQEQIVAQFEIADQFSPKTNQAILQAHDAAYPIAMELIRTTKDSLALTPLEVAEQIAQLKEGLFFDDYGTESGDPIKAFYLESDIRELTPESFRTAMGLSLDDPKEKIERYEPADSAFLTFIEVHFRVGLTEPARAIVDLMKQHLKQHTVFIIGEDYNPEVPPVHPVYVVGVGENGDIAGFESVVVWT